MDCVFRPLGCSFSSTDIKSLCEHERNIDVHTNLMSDIKIKQLLHDYRHIKTQLMEAYASRKSEDNNEKNDTIDTNESNDSNEYVTLSVPFEPRSEYHIKVLSTYVYADSSDASTFPTYLCGDQKEVLEEMPHMIRLKYPSVVIENGIHNTIIVVRFETNCIESTQFGLMNARGTYLRRLVSGSRTALTECEPVSNDPSIPSSNMFSIMQYKILHEENGRFTVDLFLQFNDFANSSNMFEGHFRDLRVLLFHMTSTADQSYTITAYDAGMPFRISPNKMYLQEKRVALAVNELKWSEPVPPVPPMMGIHPTMRIETKKRVSSLTDDSSSSPKKFKPACIKK